VRRQRDQVVAICDVRAEGRISRRALTQGSATVYWIDGGTVVCARTYFDPRLLSKSGLPLRRRS
jgi:hypothetical protein